MNRVGKIGGKQTGREAGSKVTEESANEDSKEIILTKPTPKVHRLQHLDTQIRLDLADDLGGVGDGEVAFL